MNAQHTSTAHIFIDAGLPDLTTLRAGLPADAVVHWLDASRDGLQQIADALNGQTDVAALHLITHGAPGKLFIGNSAVDREILGNSHAELEAISNAMANMAIHVREAIARHLGVAGACYQPGAGG
jgi:hypothetical protein